MTDSLLTACGVPRTHNAISEAMLWIIVFGACAFVAYYLFARLVLWIDSNRIKSFHPKPQRLSL